MPTDDERLVIDLEARIRDFERNFERANRTAQRQFGAIERRAKEAADRIERSMTTSADRSNASLERLGKGVTAVSESFKGAVAGFAAGLLTNASVEFVTKSVGELAKLNDVAERTGASARFLQEFGFAVTQSGGAVDDVGKGLEKFAVNLSKAEAGGDLAKVFEANGVALRDATGKMRPLEALLGDFAELIKNAGSEQDRLNLATMAFGRSAGPALVLALAEGRDGLSKMAAEANRAGLVLGDKLVKEAARLDDEFDKMTKSLSGLGKQFAVEFGGPAVEAGMKVLLGYLNQVKATIEDIRGLNLNDLIVRPEIRDLIAGPAPQFGPKAPDEERADLERQQGNLKARIATAEARIAAATAAGRGAAGSEAQLAKLKSDLAEIERRIEAINANPLKPVENFIPSRTGYTAGGARPTIVPSAGGDSNPFATGDAVAQFVRRVVAAESGGRADAKNPNSTATGAGQFIESTWLALFRKHYPAQAASMGESAILALRKDADISKELIERYAQENAAALRNAGLAVTEANLHLAHFLGSGGAIKALQADPRASARAVLGDKAANANPTIIGGGRSIQDVLNYAERRAGDTRIAAGDRTDAEQSADRQANAIKRVMEALGLEADQIGKTAQEQEVLSRLQQAGVDLSSREGQAIRAKVAELYALKTAQDRVELSAEASKRARETLADMGADATTGILQDLRNGASAAESFSNALGKIADQLIEMAVKQLFQSAFGAPAGGGGGGGLGFFGFLGGLFGFADGGFTGDGGKHEPAGIVHRGEFVFTKETTRRIGVENLERMQRGTKGYADGGLVGASQDAIRLPSPALPWAPAALAGVSTSTVNAPITIAPSITVNANGGTPEQNNDLAKRVAKEAESSIRGIVANELRVQMRVGNMLNRGSR